jgi:hypothetical protein
MSAEHSSGWVGAAVGGALTAVALWLVLNYCWPFGGVGLLQRQGWPWSEVYLWGVAGGLIAMTAALLRHRRRRAYAREVAEVAEALGFTYQGDVARADLGVAGNLPLFAKWSSASHRLAGRADGLDVVMLDYTYVERGEDSSTSYTQTVVLLPGSDGLPAFELRPRHLGMRMLRLVGLEGITFDPAQAPPQEAAAVEEFGRRYFLSRGLEAELKAMAERLDALGEGAPAAGQHEGAVRRLFALEVLHFFAEHPGWYVECNGTHLALWRRKAVVRASARSAFLAEALEVRSALTRAGTRTAPAAGPGGGPMVDPLTVQARMFATVLGLFAGFAAGFFVATDIFPAGPPGPGLPVAPFRFFGGVLLGLAAGALLGNRVLYWPVLFLLRRRQERHRRAVAASPWKQPADSTAVVTQDGDRLTITLPAPGLVRGTGWFLFLWCSLWNLIVVVFTALSVPAAFRGEVKWEGGNAPLHPAILLLFLVPFWLIGLSGLLALIQRGWRRAVLTVEGDRLRFEQIALFGSRRAEWRGGELADVQAAGPPTAGLPGESFSKVELCLVPRQGEPVRLLGWRPRRELKWIAGLVREKLRAAGAFQDSGGPADESTDGDGAGPFAGRRV